MTRSWRAIYDAHGKVAEYEDGRLVWTRDDAKAEASASTQVIRDIEPYKSMITGETISGRRQHRDHLRAHGCIEVGNEKMPDVRPVPTDNRREVISRRLGDMSDRQANQILKDLRRMN